VEHGRVYWKGKRVREEGAAKGAGEKGAVDLKLVVDTERLGMSKYSVEIFLISYGHCAYAGATAVPSRREKNRTPWGKLHVPRQAPWALQQCPRHR
jgi:hypothetical protein